MPTPPRTPGHAAYEAYRTQFPSVAELAPGWLLLPTTTQERWEQIAAAALKAVKGHMLRTFLNFRHARLRQD